MAPRGIAAGFAAFASGLGAHTCELVKDVPGYFSTDPNRDPDATHIGQLGFGRALEMADKGCDLVQRQALVAARERNLRVVVRAIEETRYSVISGSDLDVSNCGRSNNRDLAPA